MATHKPFPQAGFLNTLELLHASASSAVASLPSQLGLLVAADGRGLTKGGIGLMELLQARRAVLQAAFDTELAADELRRYQKFAKPGAPSPHIVQLRKMQAAARQATNVSRQSFIKAATAFVREASIELPPRVTLEVFMTGWIDANVPKDFAPAT